MHAPPPEALFLPAAPAWPGDRLCVYHAPAAADARSAIVYVHPFGEEMNKSRRMAALQARLLAAAGHAVLQIDLLGCGDSSGEFGDASWAAWIDDVHCAARWITQRHGAPLWLWGLRAGCLVAAAAARDIEAAQRFLFWQPTPAGRQLLQQFLRLKAAADLQSGRGKALMDGLRQRLAAGEHVDIAGYALAPALAGGLEAARLEPPREFERLIWLELTSRADAELPPASAACLEGWRASGARVDAQVVVGPAFWQSTEIEEAPALLQATLAMLDAEGPNGLR